MDYSLAALKLFCRHLADAGQTSSSSSAATTLFGILFQRAWLQGVLVPGRETDRLLLDDGTGVVELSLNPDLNPHDWKTGMYVMIVGLYAKTDAGDPPLIKVHKMVDLSAHPDREAMWDLEVIEACKLFYLPSME